MDKSLSVKEIQKEKEEIEREKKRIEEEMDAPMADTLMHLENECKAKMERAYRESNGKVPHILCETNYSREYKLGEEKSAFPWERRFKSLQARGRFNNFRMSCESIAIEQIGTWDKHERKCELTILHL